MELHSIDSRKRINYKSLIARLPKMGVLASHCHERLYTSRVNGDGRRIIGMKKEERYGSRKGFPY